MSLIAWFPLNGKLNDLSINNLELKQGYRLGDVNGDGKIDSTDTEMILTIYKTEECTAYQKVAGDIDGDGTINTNDASLLLNIIDAKSAESYGELAKLHDIIDEPSWSDGKVSGKSIYFPGTSLTQRLQLPMFKNRVNFSWSVWVKPQYVNKGNFEYKYCLCNGRADYNSDGWGLGYNEDLSKGYITFGSLQYVFTPEIDTWTHITFTIDNNSKGTIYFNGIMKFQSTVTALPDFSEGTYFTIGSFDYNWSAVYAFEGCMNNLKIYNHCLSQEEVLQDYMQPMLHYSFGNQDAPIIRDNSGMGHDGTILNGTLTWSNNSATGYYSTFYNETAYIKSELTLPKEMDALTYSCWAYKEDWTDISDIATRASLISCVDQGGFGIMLPSTGTLYGHVWYTNKGYYKEDTEGKPPYIDISTLSTGWHLFTISVDKNTYSYYLDGKVYYTKTHDYNATISTVPHTSTTEASSDQPNTLYIGAEGDFGTVSPLKNIYLDDIRIYPVAFTAKQVEKLYKRKSMVDNHHNLYCNQLVETQYKGLPIYDKIETSTNTNFVSSDYSLAKDISNYTFNYTNSVIADGNKTTLDLGDMIDITTLTFEGTGYTIDTTTNYQPHITKKFQFKTYELNETSNKFKLYKRKTIANEIKEI